MVVCVECGASIDSLYKIFDQDTIQIKKCKHCGCFADKYQKYDFMLMFINVLLLKKSAFRHILSNYNERPNNRSNNKSYYRNYLVFIILIFFWSFLDAYKLTLIYSCVEPVESSISENFLSAIYHIYSYDGNRAINFSLDNKLLSNGKELNKDQIFGDDNTLSTSTIDRLMYVFYQISLYMTKNSKVNSFDCEVLSSNTLVSKLYRFLIRYNNSSYDYLALIKQSIVYNTLTIFLTSAIATITIKDISEFKNILFVFLGSMYGKAFIIPTIIWYANIFIDMFVYIYVIYSYIITMHIYLNKPYSICFAIVAIPQLILSQTSL